MAIRDYGTAALQVREYVDERGRSPYANWFDSLDQHAAIKVTTAIERLALGHTSAIKPVGEGVSEYRIDFGPGYRIYFGKDGQNLVILLGGGAKKRQQNDIGAAKDVWKAYKARKKQEATWP
ncbi:MAG: type II toxin-antitoxin system RelE/ParE family toxin [Acidobacteriaceae bacterium]|jgi:putative addiction module killer protein